MKLDTLKRGYAMLNAGIWVDDIPQAMFKGISLKVRRLWNPDYRELHAQLSEETSDLSPEGNAERITTACLLQTCLLDWKGIDEPFTAALAADLAADPEAGQAFRGAVLWAANSAGDKVEAQVETDAKNSETP